MPELVLPSGYRINFVDAGRGPTLLQVGGGTLALDNYSWLRPHLTERMRVIDFDLPGFGESVSVHKQLRFQHLMEATVEMIKCVAEGRVHLSGISLGGVVAAAVAAQFPEIVDRLVIGASLFKSDKAGALMRSTWRLAAGYGGMAAVADLTVANGFSRSFLDSERGQHAAAWMREVFARRSPSEYLAKQDIAMETDAESLLPNVRATTLLIASRSDPLTPLDTAASGLGMRQAYRLIPFSTLAVLTDSGHCYYVERAHDVAEMMCDFVAGNPFAPIPGVQFINRPR